MESSDNKFSIPNVSSYNKDLIIVCGNLKQMSKRQMLQTKEKTKEVFHDAE